MVARSKGKAPGNKSPGNKSPGNKKSPGKSPPPGNRPLQTSKGVFTFTMVTDGCYIEHKWGQNSGHVGVPLEAIPGFIQRLQGLYAKATGVTLKSPGAKSPGSGPGSGPKGAINKKDGKKKFEQKKEKKEKKEPPAKPTMEDLDADLLNYTAARGAEGDAAEPAEAAPVEE